MHTRFFLFKKVEGFHFLLIIGDIELCYFKSSEMDKDTWPKPGQSEGKTCRALAALLDPNTSICQRAGFKAQHSKMQIPNPVTNCFSSQPTAGGWNRRILASVELMKGLIKPRWKETARWDGGWEKVFVSVEFCCPSCSVPVSGPWIVSSIAGSSHFQSGNKSGLYGPGGARCSQWSPDSLLKGQITQRGHSSPRYIWSQLNSGGIGGLHSSMSSPPTALSAGLTAIPPSLFRLLYLLLLLYLLPFLFLFFSLQIVFLSLQMSLQILEL